MTNAQDLTTGLDNLADIAINMDASNESAGILYTSEDAMNALHIFYHVCGNIMHQRFIRKKLPLEEASKISEQMGEVLAEVFLNFTEIDSRTYYKS